MSYPAAAVGPAYYYCYDCSYYIPCGYYCAHSYSGISSANVASNTFTRSTGRERIVLDSRRVIDHGATRTTRYTVRVYV